MDALQPEGQEEKKCPEEPDAGCWDGGREGKQGRAKFASRLFLLSWLSESEEGPGGLLKEY